MPSTTIPKTILLRGTPAAREGKANAPITPGHLVEQMAGGNYRKHSVAAGVAAPLFAREEEYVGGGIDTDYATQRSSPILGAARRAIRSMPCCPRTLRRSSSATTWKAMATAHLRKTTHAVTSATTAAAWPIARALEAIDNSANGAVVRIRAEVL